MSSPSRQVIDPLIYSYPENGDSSVGNKTSSVSSASASLPPASKLLGTTGSVQQTPGITGWTPLISRTISNEVISYNSTPSSKMFPSATRQSVAMSGSANGAMEYDYPSLNLTPFLTHNLNLLNNPNSAGNLSNNIAFTPFYDKSIHLNDFFMDSPIRQTPLKAETITPSKFVIATDPKSSSQKFKANFYAEPSQKRSLTLLDTPARQPYKKISTTFKNEVCSDNEDDFNDGDSKKYDGDGFVTPSKKKYLTEMSANVLNKTPLKSTPLKNLYHTPGRVPNSSPSTVIMSSATKSPDQDNKEPLIPPSPTPKKENIEITEPVMGIFSEKKNPPKSADAKPNIKKNQKKQLNGMNRFQIVFTDVHTLMNNRKKKNLTTNLRADKTDKKTDKKKTLAKANKGKPASPLINYGPSMIGDSNIQHSLSSFHHTSSNLSTSQDFNSTINTSKEFSIIGNNTTFNTTANNINSSSDHNSFELMHGGMISTPNGKFLLDNLFDEQSPHVLRSMSTRSVQVKLEESAHQMPPPKGHSNGLQVHQDHASMNSQYLHPGGPSQHLTHNPHLQHQHRRHQMQRSPYDHSSLLEHQNHHMTSFVMSTP